MFGNLGTFSARQGIRPCDSVAHRSRSVPRTTRPDTADDIPWGVFSMAPVHCGQAYLNLWLCCCATESAERHTCGSGLGQRRDGWWAGINSHTPRAFPPPCSPTPLLARVAGRGQLALQTEVGFGSAKPCRCGGSSRVSPVGCAGPSGHIRLGSSMRPPGSGGGSTTRQPCPDDVRVPRYALVVACGAISDQQSLAGPVESGSGDGGGYFLRKGVDPPVFGLLSISRGCRWLRLRQAVPSAEGDVAVVGTSCCTADKLLGGSVQTSAVLRTPAGYHVEASLTGSCLRVCPPVRYRTRRDRRNGQPTLFSRAPPRQRFRMQRPGVRWGGIPRAARCSAFSG